MIASSLQTRICLYKPYRLIHLLVISSQSLNVTYLAHSSDTFETLKNTSLSMILTCACVAEHMRSGLELLFVKNSINRITIWAHQLYIMIHICIPCRFYLKAMQPFAFRNICYLFVSQVLLKHIPKPK